MLETLLADLRFAIRSVGRDRGFALVAALTVALGVGSTTTVLSVANALLVRRLPVPEPDRVVVLTENRGGAVSGGMEGLKLPLVRHEAYRDATAEIFEALAAHRFTEVSLRLPDRTLSAQGVFATSSYWDALRIQPALGRFFDSDDAPEVVLSHRLWRERFREDPGAIGQSVSLDGRPYTVVGVAPATFTGTTVAVPIDFWVPIATDDPAAAAGFGGWVAQIGRLRPGVEMEAASALVNAVALRVPPDEPQTRVRSAELDVVTSVSPMLRSGLVSGSALFLGLALLVLLIASANIAGMMLARGFARRRELAVRLSIGAGRSRVIRHLIAESLILFLLGGVGGVALSYLGTSALAATPIPINPPPVLDLTPDVGVLTLALALTLGTGLLFGLAPALQASRTDLVSALKDGGVQGGSRGGRGRGFFVTAQMAMSVLLLLAAVLFARSLQQGLARDPGFRTDDIVAGGVDVAPRGYDDGRSRIFFAELVERMRAVPGVEAVGLSSFTLLDGGNYRSDVRPSAPGQGGRDRINARFGWADPELFATMGIEMVAGRGIEDGDVEGAEPVVLVSETLARALWPEQNPIGQRLRGTDVEEREVVGVVRDGFYTTLIEEPLPFVFIPLAQGRRSFVAVHVRAPGAEGAALRALEDVVRALDPDIALSDATPLDRMVDASLWGHRLASRIVGLFGLIGLALAAIGLYGVLAFNVAHRTREFAVRRALGARRNDVVVQVLKRGGVLIVVGAVIGLGLGAALARVLRAFLIGIGPFDPVSFVSVPLVLLLVALLASLRPAQRALAVEPTEALRQD
jgi:predicted permease